MARPGVQGKEFVIAVFELDAPAAVQVDPGDFEGGAGRAAEERGWSFGERGSKDPGLREERAPETVFSAAVLGAFPDGADPWDAGAEFVVDEDPAARLDS